MPVPLLGTSATFSSSPCSPVRQGLSPFYRGSICHVRPELTPLLTPDLYFSFLVKRCLLPSYSTFLAGKSVITHQLEFNCNPSSSQALI